MRTKGFNAERQALNYLKRQGLTLISQNYSSRFGEIDLIMQGKAEIIFIEVRYRKNNNFGSPAATVNFKKQQRIIKTAYSYLNSLPFTPPCRFDVIAITASELEWIQDAFQV
ncbi:YraN family protein [Piscirickettsia litoralis]|uniref:YraN family protein n=1 Tax=Piscirickettsia litoralis TaxID=1891921 RepID=UPI0009811EE8|nr:YraN family protein [Piscirickettsia litoralis]